MDRVHPHSFDVCIVKPPAFVKVSTPRYDDTPPYTPHSKSLDLLRTETASPVASRLSLDTISTLRGHHISSPIFLNSSTGVKPLLQKPRQLEDPAIHIDELEEDQDDAITPLCRDGRLAAVTDIQMRAPTIPRSFTDISVSHTALQPKTPSRRHKSSDQLLKSKFSMSPVQPSKWSKARNSQDRTSEISERFPEANTSQDAARSALGNWSHSIGMAARKLQKSTMLPSFTVETQAATLQVPRDHLETNITPEKGKNSLRTATSLASIRRFITPSRRFRKVSSARGFAGSGQPILTASDAVNDHPASPDSAVAQDCWIDVDGRASRADLPRDDVNTAASREPCACSVHDVKVDSPALPPVRGLKQTQTDKAAPQHQDFLPSEGEESIPISLSLKNESALDPPTRKGSLCLEPGPPDISITTATQQLQDSTIDAAGEAPEPTLAPVPSKLKTLQLLARQPFTAFGKKFRSMDKSWWPSRGSQDISRPSDVGASTGQEDRNRFARQPRRSEDLCSCASPRACESASMANKSRSVELERMHLASKVVPLRPSASSRKQRPIIHDAFSKPVPPCLRAQAVQPMPVSSAHAHISEVRHPWMKQLNLAANPSALASGTVTQTGPGTRQVWPEVGMDNVSVPHKTIPKVSLTAASVALNQPIADLAPALIQQSYFRPPSSLLGQSLPIPPRSGRSRASTISSQSSTTSSPSGKVIVSRRSYGQRLRSPSSREETASIRSVGTSILFTGSPPSTPELYRLMSPTHITRSPHAYRARSSPKSVRLPKFSPHRSRQTAALHRKSSSASMDHFESEEAQEWMDDAPTAESTLNELLTLRSRFEEALPPARPGFLEMTEATQTLSSLVKTFSGSSGSLSLHSSPYKKSDTPDRNVRNPRGLYGITEADELGMAPIPSSRQLPSPLRRRLISIASVVSTEANSSFEDSEELQKLLDSIMAADLDGGSSDTSGSRDMALLSPFGSPEEYKHSRSDERVSQDEKGKDKPRQPSPMPPPPKFLLNDRPISPPDSSWMSDVTHGDCAPVGTEDVGSSIHAPCLGSHAQQP